MKFSPQHFPVGTVVRLSDNFSWLSKDGSSNIITVTGIIRNGYKSYCLKTGVFSEETGEEAYNLDHVMEIIKRGDGPVLIDQNAYGGFSSDRKNQTKLIIDSTVTADNGQSLRRRGYLVGWGLHDLIGEQLVKVLPADQMIEFGELVEDIRGHSWVKTATVWGHTTMFLVNKKRLKRWVKVNVNRYLLNLTVADKEHDKYMNEIWAEDPDYFFAP